VGVSIQFLDFRPKGRESDETIAGLICVTVTSIPSLALASVFRELK
jgi:hypothetical protein